MKVTKSDARKVAKYFNINLKVIPLETLTYALNVELEHANVTNNDLGFTARIAIAHFLEFPDYYERLKIMEKEADKYWGNKEKPNIFNK